MKNLKNKVIEKYLHYDNAWTFHSFEIEYYEKNDKMIKGKDLKSFKKKCHEINVLKKWQKQTRRLFSSEFSIFENLAAESHWW